MPKQCTKDYTTRNPTLSAALEYAKAGFPVFPCVGKEPLTENGHKAATTDPQRIAKWFDRPNPPNVAIVPPKGYAIVDEDPRNGGSVADLNLPPTLIANTGGGGRHYFFRECPSDLPGKLGPGLDLKRNGRGYVIAPPSIHPVTGKPYVWPSGFNPAEIQVWPAGLVASSSERPEPDSALPDRAALTPSQLRKLLRKIRADDYEDWVAVGQSLHDVEGGFDLWLDWSARSSKFPGDAECRRKWKTFKGKGRGIGTLVHMAGGRIDRPEPQEEFDAVPTEKTGLLVRKASEVEEKRVDWLVPGYVARGVLHCVAGYGGEGKSSALSALISAVSNGANWITGEILPSPIAVAIITEEPFAFQTKPRLRLAGADLDRVFQIEGVGNASGELEGWNLVDHEKKTREFLTAHPEIQLLVIDPVGSYMNGKKKEINTWKDSDVRIALGPWQRVAEDFGIAIIFIAHFAKGKADRAMNLVTGSAAFTTVTRMSYAVVQPPTGYLSTFGLEEEFGDDMSGQRILFPIKVNIGPPPAPVVLKFEHIADNDNPRVSVMATLPRMRAEELMEQMKAAGNAEARGSGLQDRLLEAIKEHPGSSKRAVARAAGANLESEGTRRAFQELAARGLITTRRVRNEDWVFDVESGNADLF